ncbi:formate dehydrogenase accessory sulfurtransferase FdhD [Streptomyces sp. H27-D2]|uniref:formate dehydrogenase accessory sulfurtransferase FdhD n=1 Tax=Streptomyces sp. H27-D2 TaxID=3046304 RepID=UPI002DBF248C|nr:formate dehydrogenase accessory sulfurtransferase FdhD [Streptomyces sp. H27-D2]MEC4020180.1 formate dehydrogenase accessory sulfurtransferase FdhD [Streptomyces sp. H27-D2]
MSRVTSRHKVLRLNGSTALARPDTLAGEEPLEIRIGGEQLTVTMRTPGHDFDLVAGFLANEGVIGSADELIALRYCGDAGTENTYNLIDADLAPGTELPASLNRNLLTTSACGICGRDSIDSVRTRTRWPVADDPARIAPDVLYGLPDTLRTAQRTFASTGGLHAAGLFSTDGELLCAREDVGRHNAVDKVVGWALREGRLPLRGCVLMVSGRASFELTQKAVMAGIPVLAAVSAPSSLAADLAQELGLTLIGFLRGRTANIYTGGQRVILD